MASSRSRRASRARATSSFAASSRSNALMELTSGSPESCGTAASVAASAAGRGTGGGVSVEPVAFLVVREDDVQLLHLQTPGSPMGQLVELIPDIIDQLKDRLDDG